MQRLTGRERKTAELGMSISKAHHWLYKKIMFELVQQTGRDTCFRCGRVIATADEMSIDHKRDWLGVDSSLFWDLDNIAFSHKRCNVRRAEREPNVRVRRDRKEGPEGTSWCSACREFLPQEQFNRNANRWNGIHNQCRRHRASYLKPQESS